jgi:hypothetical protein
MISPYFRAISVVSVKLPYRTIQKKTGKYKTPWMSKTVGKVPVDGLVCREKKGLRNEHDATN